MLLPFEFSTFFWLESSNGQLHTLVSQRDGRKIILKNIWFVRYLQVNEFQIIWLKGGCFDLKTYVLNPSRHTTSKRRPSNVHNVQITLYGRWNNVVCQLGYVLEVLRFKEFVISFNFLHEILDMWYWQLKVELNWNVNSMRLWIKVICRPNWTEI